MGQSTTFQELNISANILKALEEIGLKTPTEIQEKTIALLSKTYDRDFVGQAQTGTGKTAAFVIPLLSQIDSTKVDVQALVLVPTRELATQVEQEIRKIGKYTQIKSTCVYGGTVYEGQIKALKEDRPQIVVGTPGRVIDLIKKNILKLSHANFCVLDEADEMLNMGFLEDVQTILEKFKGHRQLMMFSATMPPLISKLIKKSFNDPLMVKIAHKSLSNTDIEQKYFIVREKHFKEGLARLIDHATDLYGIVFCRTKIETREVADDLKKRGYSVEVLNGDMGQPERDLAMRNFKLKKSTLMVCTDVAARGIDISNLTHVFNYGLPRDNESYMHRIGRTARAGRKGIAYTILAPNSTYAIKNLENHTNQIIQEEKLPSIEILKRKLVEKEMDSALQILDAIKLKGSNFKTEDSFDIFQQKFGHLANDELLKVMFVWKFNKEMRRYNNLADIEESHATAPKKAAKKDRPRPVHKRKKK